MLVHSLHSMQSEVEARAVLSLVAALPHRSKLHMEVPDAILFLAVEGGAARADMSHCQEKLCANKTSLNAIFSRSLRSM